MVLSTGTLNLKFMQRAAARTAKVAPAGPSSASPAPASPAQAASTTTSATVASPAPHAPAPVPGTPAPAAPSGGPVAAEEAEAKWVLPRRGAASSSTAGPSTTKPRVQFVASYLPFLEDDDEPTAMAPGRMKFGMIETEEKQEEGGADDDDGEFDMDDSEDEVEVRRDKGKGRAEGVSGRFGGGDLARTVSRVSRIEKTPEPESMPATFQRPRGFSPERGGKGQAGVAGAGKKDKGNKGGKGKEKTTKDSKSAVSSNLYSRLRDKLSIGSGSSPDNSPPSSAASTPGGSGKKRARSPEMVSTEALKVGKKKKFGSGSDGLGGSLDERERKKKEAKKAEKKANKGLSKKPFFS